MAVCLSGLHVPGLPAFDAVGERATLAQRSLTRKDEFELYVTASGIKDPTQKRALLLHLAGLKVRDIFNNLISATERGELKDYKIAMECLSEHFKLKTRHYIVSRKHKISLASLFSLISKKLSIPSNGIIFKNV